MCIRDRCITVYFKSVFVYDFTLHNATLFIISMCIVIKYIRLCIVQDIEMRCLSLFTL